MQRCVLPAFLNNDIEMVSAVLQTVEPHAVMWMFQETCWVGRGWEGKLEEGQQEGWLSASFFLVTPSAPKKEDATKNNVCAWISKRNYVKWRRTLLCCLEEQFCNQRTFQWSKSEGHYPSFVQKIYFNRLLEYYQRRTNLCSHCDAASLYLCPLHSILVCVLCLRHPAFVPSNMGKILYSNAS